ncbi:MAG: SpoIIE family protein phosphatase [Selenomonadaceae bacterium]|nr:SpoIIE family protein phosphatase [Selenomonadaceae bacterium]
MKNMNIRQRMIFIVLSISIATLIILSGIAFYGMWGAKSTAREIGREIGQEATENSAKTLIEQKKLELINLAADKASDINHNLDNIRRDVQILSSEMTHILTNPGNYSPQPVSEPNPANGGVLVPQLLFSNAYARNNWALDYEIGLTANIIDMSYEFLNTNEVMVTAFAASKNGFTILTDTYSDEQGEFFDSQARPWYKLAEEQGKLVFTDVIEDVLNGELCMLCSMPYYQNGNFAGVVAMGSYITDMKKIVESANGSNKQFAFVIDNNGHVILSSYDKVIAEGQGGELLVNVDKNFDIREIENQSLAETAKKMSAGENGVTEATIDGINYYIAYAPIEGMGWSCAAAIPESEVIAPAIQNSEVIKNVTDTNINELDAHIFQTMLIMAAFIVALLFVVAYVGRKTSDRFVQPIHELADGVREIASGNLDKKLDIQTGDEIEHLSACFNAMTDELKTYMNNLTKVAAEKEKIATELNVARDIQKGMLPNIFPAYPERKEFDIYATMNAAKEVGGDFYDFYLLDENHLVVTIADVSGKGIPAALFMMISKTILKNFSMTMNNPDDFAAVMTLANNQLCQNNDAMMFVTVFMGMLNLKTGEFTFVNGGHNPPLVYHKANNSYEYIKVKKNFVLGGMDDINYIQQSIKLEKGDLIFMYTDGVTEAMNKNEELYGEERLINCLNRSDKNFSVEELLNFVRADVNAHVNGAAQSDDITMLALKINP